MDEAASPGRSGWVSNSTHPNPDPEIILFAAVLQDSLMAQSGFFAI